MFKVWRLCECCKTFVATNMLKDQHLCRTCFMKLKQVEVRLEESRTLAQRKADAQQAIDEEANAELDAWMQRSEGNCVGR